MAIKPLSNESELLAKIAEGNEAAFKELFDGYYNTLGEYLFQLTGSLAESEEILQDNFVKVWVQRQKLTQIKNFSNYIFILCKNQAYNSLKKQAVERKIFKYVDKTLLENINDGNLDDSLQVYRRLIDAAVDKLPPQAQKIYLMSRDERLKYEEIAEKTKISSETVKKHIQYAQNFIKNEVKSHISDVLLIILLSPLVFN